MLLKTYFCYLSYSTWARSHAKHARHVGALAREHARNVDTFAWKHARHVGMWARKHARNVGTWTQKHARHLTWACDVTRKNARHVCRWARKARNLADSYITHCKTWNLKQFMKLFDSIRTNHAQVLVIRSLDLLSVSYHCSSILLSMKYSIFVNFKYLINSVGICSVINYVVV